MWSGVPSGSVDVPAAVRVLAGGRPLVPVWRNEVGGTTWRAGDDRFVKWAPAGSGLPLEQEAARLRWAVGFTAVPVVLDVGRDEEGGWLVTAALPGRNA